MTQTECQLKVVSAQQNLLCRNDKKEMTMWLNLKCQYGSIPNANMTKCQMETWRKVTKIKCHFKKWQNIMLTGENMNMTKCQIKNINMGKCQWENVKCQYDWMKKI
jgi:hypothetical protein